MKNLGWFVAVVLCFLHLPASALVVKEPGQFTLTPNTDVVVTVVGSGSDSWFKFQLRRTDADGTVLSSDSFFSATSVEETMVFYWDDARKLLWFGTRKFVSSLPETALEKDKHIAVHPAKWMPTTWDRTGAWMHWNTTQMPCGGIPESFLKQARQIFGP